MKKAILEAAFKVAKAIVESFLEHAIEKSPPELQVRIKKLEQDLEELGSELIENYA